MNKFAVDRFSQTRLLKIKREKEREREREREGERENSRCAEKQHVHVNELAKHS